MANIIQVKKKENGHGFTAIYDNQKMVDCECFYGGEEKIEVGNIIWDERYEEYRTITTQKQINDYFFVAPELYIIIKLKQEV